MTELAAAFSRRHLLGIEGLTRPEIESLLDLADEAVSISRQVEKKRTTLRGRTQINLFFEASTRTQSSFELAGKRLTLRTLGQPALGHRFGGEHMNMPRVTRTVRGDFEATVTVLNATPPNRNARHVGSGPDTRAGLFVVGGGGGVELLLRQLHSTFNGSVAEYLQRCVWIESWHAGAGVGAAVVDEDHFIRQAQRPERPVELFVQRKQAVLFVEDRDDYGEVHRG